MKRVVGGVLRSVLSVALLLSTPATSSAMTHVAGRAVAERTVVDGRVAAFHRDGDGYRVRLDRDRRWFWVPQSHFRVGRELRIGVSLHLGGVYRRGVVYVDEVRWPVDRARYDVRRDYDDRRDDILRGRVERVAYRESTLLLREPGSRRVIEVDMRGVDRHGRLDLDDVRRGDFVVLSGERARGEFVAWRIDDIRSR